MKIRPAVFLVFLLFAVTFVAAQSKKPLTDADVIQMVKAGFNEQTIIDAVGANEPAYDTSVQGLLALKSAGVSEKIIDAMLSATARKNRKVESRTPASNAAATSPPGMPDEVGVYVKLKGQLKEIEPEIVTWRTGGVLKHMASMGLTKGHVNGVVERKHSSLDLAPPLEFIIRCPQGVSAGEYQLLRLDQHGSRREFRAYTGGILHASGGAERNAVPDEPEKIAPYTYRIKINQLKKGEYGFLPPGAYVSSSAASVGKIYTFRIVE